MHLISLSFCFLGTPLFVGWLLVQTDALISVSVRGSLWWRICPELSAVYMEEVKLQDRKE